MLGVGAKYGTVRCPRCETTLRGKVGRRARCWKCSGEPSAGQQDVVRVYVPVADDGESCTDRPFRRLHCKQCGYVGPSRRKPGSSIPCPDCGVSVWMPNRAPLWVSGRDRPIGGDPDRWTPDDYDDDEPDDEPYVPAARSHFLLGRPLVALAPRPAPAAPISRPAAAPMPAPPAAPRGGAAFAEAGLRVSTDPGWSGQCQFHGRHSRCSNRASVVLTLRGSTAAACEGCAMVIDRGATNRGYAFRQQLSAVPIGPAQ
jgi:hypothetical protein